MKGRMSNICRANGGSTGMRDIAGYKAPSYGTDKSVLKAAEGKTVGMIPDGESAKGRLDRPGRKHGGKVMHEGKKKDHKADGGGVTDYLRDKAAKSAYDNATTWGDSKAQDKAGDDFDRFKGAYKKFGKTGLPDKPKGDDSDNGRKNGGRAPMHLDFKKGALRKTLHVKDGEKIPEKKLEKAEHSENPLTKKRAVMAETMRGWNHGGKKD